MFVQATLLGCVQRILRLWSKLWSIRGIWVLLPHPVAPVMTRCWLFFKALRISASF